MFSQLGDKLQDIFKDLRGHGTISESNINDALRQVRLALLEALSHAAEEITREVAPRSVDVRLRGREPEFTVSPAVHDEPEPVAAVPEADDDGGTWRVTLRLPESLRSPVDAAARADGLSVNAWLVRAVASTLGGKRHARANTDKHFSGWVR